MVSADEVVLADEVVSAGVAPPGGGELDVGEAGVEGLVLTGADDVAVTLGDVALTLGLAVAEGVTVAQGFPAAVAAFLLPVALVLAFAEAVVVLPAALALWVPVAVAVAVAVLVAVAVPLSPGLALPLAVLVPGLLLVPLGGVVTGLAGDTLGVTDLAGLAAAGDEDVGEHAVVFPLLRPAGVRPWLVPPPVEPAWLPDPATLGALVLMLEEEIPTAEAIWTTASRSGGTARAKPMANTAQAAARAGRSSPYRQSRASRRAPPPALLPRPAVSWPPRATFQRRARKPPRAEAPECLLA